MSYYFFPVFQIAVYNVALLTTEIDDHVYLPSITKYPTFHKYGQLYYKMDQESGDVYLRNEGLLGINGRINGNVLFKEVGENMQYINVRKIRKKKHN